MKLLVIGGSGLIGSNLLRAAANAGHIATGTFRENPIPGLVQLDCADTRAAEALIEKEKPDCVVHAAGWTWVDGCEDDPKRALAENAEQPEMLARICKQAGVHFTYISTSYVFDGKNGPYTEDAAPNPINVYAKSKWEGEQRVQQACGGQALIPRVICVYGAEERKKNFAWQVWRAMTEGKTLTLPSDQCGNPTYAADIARWLISLLEQRERGAWHLGGPWPDCSRTEWAEKLRAAFIACGVKTQKGFAIQGITTAELKQRALRPLKAGMIAKRQPAINFFPTDFNRSICEMLKRPTMEAILRLFAWLICGVSTMFLIDGAVLRAANVQDGQNSPLALLLGSFTLHGPVIVLVPIFLHFEKLTFRDVFGISKNGARQAMLFGLVAAVVFLPVGYALQELSARLMILAHHAPVEEEAVKALSESQTLGMRLWLDIWAVVAAPVAEEIVFRGLLYPAIKRAGFPRAAFWGTSLLFGLIHANLAAFVPLTVLAMVLVWLYERTDNLLAPIAAHGFFNAAGLVFLVMQEHGWLDKLHLGQ